MRNKLTAFVINAGNLSFKESQVSIIVFPEIVYLLSVFEVKSISCLALFRVNLIAIYLTRNKIPYIIFIKIVLFY